MEKAGDEVVKAACRGVPCGRPQKGLRRSGTRLAPTLVLTGALFFCFVFITAFQRISFAEEIPQRLDGRVAAIDLEKRILSLGFEHPATGEHIERDFYVAEDAGFKDFKKLSELKEGDLVSLDYLDYRPVPKAIYIVHIPLEKVYFTHKEVAQALVQIKSNQKDQDAAKV